MKLLFVADSLPYPPSRGYLQLAYNQIRHLAQRHTIDLIAFQNRDHGIDDPGPLREACRSITLVQRGRWRSLANVALAIGSSTPFSVAYFQSHAMERAVTDAVRAQNYDAIVVLMSRMGHYLPEAGASATLLSAVDPMLLSYERSLRWRPWYTRLLLRSELRRLERYEPRTFARFAAATLIAPGDVEQYRDRLGVKNIIRIPYGTDVDRFTMTARADRIPGRLVMTGSMFYAPNVRAAEFFGREVFPRVRAAVRDATLYIVGSRPSASVRRLSRVPGITVTGAVDDIRPYLTKAMVSVCPVDLAIGTQTKILEALAAGTPVVTTSAGNYGVGAMPGVHLHVADHPDDFAARVVELLNGAAWDSMSSGGRDFVCREFSWQHGVEAFERLLKELRADAVSA